MLGRIESNREIFGFTQAKTSNTCLRASRPRRLFVQNNHLFDARASKQFKRSHTLIPKASERQAANVLPFGPGTIREIPVFPLSVVAFPTGNVPLNIFEARYRVLFSTLLAGADGVDEDLINYQKPWRGSRLFGMCYVTNEGTVVSVGTTLHIVQHERLPDGRLFIVSKGVEKFQILKVLEERPVMVCQVKMLEDSDDQSQPVKELARHDIQLFRDLLQLNVKMNKLSSPQMTLDTKFDEMSPREISYWLALIFQQNPMVQQALLEEKSLERRLIHERDILEKTTSFLRARVALQSAFSTDEASEGTEEKPEDPKKPKNLEEGPPKDTEKGPSDSS